MKRRIKASALLLKKLTSRNLRDPALLGVAGLLGMNAHDFFEVMERRKQKEKQRKKKKKKKK